MQLFASDLNLIKCLTSMTDEKLVRRCLKNNREAQRELFEKFSGKMMTLCIRYAGNQEDAKDILQEGFIKVFQNLNQFSGKGSLYSWIRAIMVTTALRFIRKSSYVTEMVDLNDTNIPDNISHPESILNSKDLLEIISRLPAGFRTVFNLFAIEGYSHKEIGQMLEISESTSKTQFIRAKARIQHLIKEYNPALSV